MRPPSFFYLRRRKGATPCLKLSLVWIMRENYKTRSRVL
nr:MAG TPA: hypothetical protein [Caudoviricetes sp.]